MFFASAISRHTMARLVDDSDVDDKFAFVVKHFKPFHAKRNSMIYMNSEYQLFMYRGQFDVCDLATVVLDHGKGTLTMLPGAEIWFSAMGSVNELVGLPKSRLLEIGYGCFGCKAGFYKRDS